jgi:3-oxoacyl-[acyl-carrier-protein] synthase II
MVRKIVPASAAYAVVAAGEALATAGIARDAAARTECGLYVGSVQLDVDFSAFVPAITSSLDRQGQLNLRLFADHGARKLDPLFLVKALPNNGLCGNAMEHQVLGPNLAITNGSSGGLQAVAMAAEAVRSGRVPLALAGGYDSLVRLENAAEHVVANRVCMKCEAPSQACRPFDVARDGYALGEGAAFVVLEDEARARARGARVHGIILSCGHGAQGGARQPYDHDEVPLVQAAAQALADGGCDVADVDVLFGDGLAVEHDDVVEARAVRRALEGGSPLFTSATGSIGFTGAAGGALSFVHATLALAHGTVPPMINCENPDPRCGLNFAHISATRRCARALVWSRDRWGRATSVLLGRASN